MTPAMSGGGQHLCFFSTRCRYSQAFLEELSRTPYSREFRFVCVDAPPGGVRPTLPPYVRAVPTLMIQGEHEPRTDAAVMNWLSERRLMDREAGPALATPMSVAAAGGGGRPPVGGGRGPMAGGGSGGGGDGPGPAAFGGSEFMLGAGDEGFSFIGEDTTATKGGFVRMMGNMASFSDLGASTGGISHVGPSMSSAGGGVGGGGGGPQTAKAKAMEDAFERMMSDRDRGIPGPVKRM